MFSRSLLAFFLSVQTVVLHGQDFQIEAPQNWRGERIELPPDFARDMKLKGFEKIRFAPGMFDPKSESFFSYVLVFSIAKDSDTSAANLTAEFLKYYRGLAAAVMKSQKKEVDTSTFLLELRPEPKGRSETGEDTRQLSGELRWIEPFRTHKQQTIQIRIDILRPEDASRVLLFTQASPAAEDAKIWTQMKAIRDRFLARQ